MNSREIAVLRLKGIELRIVEQDVLAKAHIESLDKLDERDKITKETHRLWKEYKDEAEAKLEAAEKVVHAADELAGPRGYERPTDEEACDWLSEDWDKLVEALNTYEKERG